MKTTRLSAAMMVAFATVQTVSAQTAPLAKADADRLVALAQANLAEIAAGKMALEKSGNADVKAFAQQMIDDHGKGLDETRRLAASKNVALPAEPDAAHRKMAADMQKLTGPAFDKAYVAKAGVGDHAKVHAALRKDIAGAGDADVKALATKLEPIVARHGEMAKKLNADVK